MGSRVDAVDLELLLPTDLAFSGVMCQYRRREFAARGCIEIAERYHSPAIVHHVDHAERTRAICYGGIVKYVPCRVGLEDETTVHDSTADRQAAVGILQDDWFALERWSENPFAPE